MLPGLPAIAGTPSPQEQREGFIPLCPDFVIELRSRTDTVSELQAKMQEYLDNGAQLGWLIDPKRKWWKFTDEIEM